MAIKIVHPVYSVLENCLKKAFVDKSEAVEIMVQREIFRMKQKPFETFWKKLQGSKLNDKYVHMTGKNLALEYTIPKDYRNKAYVLETVKSLDEGRDFIHVNTFSSFKPAIYRI